MKTKQFTLLLSITLLLVTSCKNNSFEYKYADKEDTIACNNAPANIELMKEALYSFEYELIANYSRKTANVSQGYAAYMSTALSERIPNANAISEHTRKVIAELKKEKDLWVISNGKYTLNYHNDLITCLSDNFLNENLQTTLKALISTNSMSPKLFGSPLRTQIRNATKDKFLGTFIALDMYYSKLMDIDFSKVPLPLELTKDGTLTPVKPQLPPSASKQ